MIRFLLIFHCLCILGFSQYASAVVCQNSTDVNVLLNCLLSKHPEVDVADLNVQVAKQSVEQASQRPNPQLQWQGTETQGVGGLTNEFNLQHTIELGSKQPARVDFAKSDLALQRIGVESTFNQIKISLIAQLYRLRQIFHEIEVIEENRHTFKRMISQYKRIGRMNPEQEISINVFRMASEEVKLTLSQLENERDQILADFKVITRENFVPKPNQLPKLIHKWESLEKGEFEGPLVKQANAEVIRANKQYDLEKSESWPNISVGPRVVQIPGPQGGNFLGASINLPLPVLNLNGGGRAAALANKKRQEYRRDLINRRIDAEAERLIRAYNRSSEAYRTARESSNFHGKHTELHKMINRGVVTPSMVIELHRQIIAFYQSLHAQELAAVRAKWEYYSLLGSLANREIEKFGVSNE